MIPAACSSTFGIATNVGHSRLSLREPAEPIQRRAEVIEIDRLGGIDGDRAPDQLPGFLEPFLLEPDHPQHMQRPRLPRLLPNQPLIDRLRLGQIALLMEAHGVIKCFN
jgi:hypothetical protein